MSDLLAERRKQYGIPEIPYLPMADDILVFRVPAEEKTKGGIILTADANEPKSYGVLISAGLKAYDVMFDHLVQLGDIVWFGTYEGEEKEIVREVGEEGVKLLQMKIRGVRGSVEAVERSKGCVIKRDEETGEHYYERKKK